MATLREFRRGGAVDAARYPATRSLLLACTLCAGLACDGGITEPATTGTIVLDLRALTGAGLDNGVSVAARVTLSVSLPNSASTVFTPSIGIAPTDSIATFDFDLPAGVYDFFTSVFSNNDTLLYSGSTIALSEASPIIIVPQVRNAVFVVSPGAAGPLQPLFARNVGNQGVSWAACVVDPTGQCSVQYLDPARGFLVPGASERVDVGGLPAGTWTVRFTSTVGSVDARKTL
ncbi:MAG: hypothetical protein L0271_00630 [Gemmatimonadetes bacterium]|nr:hypothetical protein [Gemmatimonadota bacterium]